MRRKGSMVVTLVLASSCGGDSSGSGREAGEDGGGISVTLGTATDSAPTMRQRTVELSFDFYARTGLSEFKNLLVGMRSDPNMAVRLTVAEFLLRLPQVKPPVGADSAKILEKLRQEEAAAASAQAASAPDLGATVSDAAAAASAQVEERPSAPTAPVSAPNAADAAALSQLVEDARTAIKSKKYAPAQSMLERAQRQLSRGGARSPLLGEVLALRGSLHELRGQWRQAMAAYTQFQRLPPAQQKPQTAQTVLAATTRLKERMGLIQIYTMRDGQCRMTEVTDE